MSLSDIYKYVVRGSLAGVAVAAFASVLEIAWWMTPSFEPVYAFFVSIYRPGFPHLGFWGRLSSVGFEPHALGLWLGYIYPLALWFTIRHYRSRKNFTIGIASLLALIVMIVFSQSRAGMLTVALVSAATAICFIELRRSSRAEHFAIWTIFMVFIAIIMVQAFGRNAFGEAAVGGAVSNLSRQAMLAGAYDMGSEHPFFGRGLGQFAFLAKGSVPNWGWASLELKHWLVLQERGWPSAYSLPARLFGELGLFGIALWYGGIFVISWRAWRASVNDPSRREASFLCAMLMPYLLFSGFANDTFAQGGFWVGLGLLTALGNAAAPRRSDANNPDRNYANAHRANSVYSAPN